jgi:Uma2 family endonuclease
LYLEAVPLDSWLRCAYRRWQDGGMVAVAPKEQLYVEPPDVSHIVTEDDAPVDNFLSEKQQRLLAETLYSSWEGPRPDESGQPRTFVAAANVGLFATPRSEPLVPDVFVSLDVKLHEDLSAKQHRTYFFWEMGKPPDLALEIVSNREGGEIDRKLRGYARMRIPYYAVYDPAHHLGPKTLQAWELRGDLYISIEPWFPSLELGLAEWDGPFEGIIGKWLRWTRRDGSLLLTGSERAEAEARRAEAEARRADAEAERASLLAEKLRALGIEP